MTARIVFIMILLTLAGIAAGGAAMLMLVKSVLPAHTTCRFCWKAHEWHADV